MNIRNIALIAAVFSVAAANAQSFELRPVTGGNFEGFNAATNTFLVDPGTGSFSVEVWVNMATGQTASGVYGALGFDHTVNATSSFVFGRRDNVMNFVSHTMNNALLPAGDFANTPTFIRRAATSTGAGANYSVIGTGATANAPVVFYFGQQGAVPTARFGSLTPLTFRVATITMSYVLPNVGDIYGDTATEVGLQMLHQGGEGDPTLGASGLNTLQGPQPGRIGSVKYRVEAVPEPMTMTALGLGLAAIAARRRRKG